MIALLFASLAALLGPWLPWAIARSERWVTVVFGVGGALAVRLLGRRPERTARTATIVFVATTMTVGFGHTMLNTLVDVRAWAGRAIPADFLVRGSMPDPGFLVTSALPESIGGELRQVSGAQAVDQITFISSRAGGTPVLVLARTFPSEGPLPLDLRGRDPGPIRRGLASGEAVVADGLARSLAIRVGDAIVLDTPRGPHSVRVAGTVTEYAGGGAALYLDWHTSQSLFGPSGVHAFLVSAGPNDRPAVAAQLKTFCTTRGLLLQSNAELSSTIDSLTQALTAALWSILVLVFVVAGLGVGNAIAVSTHEQRRDMELLRAIGMTSSAIRGSTRIQGVLLMAVGAVPGVLGGVTLALILARVIEGLWGYRVPFHLEWGLILVTFGLTTITGAAAGPACGFPVHKLRQIKD